MVHNAFEATVLLGNTGHNNHSNWEFGQCAFCVRFVVNSVMDLVVSNQMANSNYHNKFWGPSISALIIIILFC